MPLWTIFRFKSIWLAARIGWFHRIIGIPDNTDVELSKLQFWLGLFAQMCRIDNSFIFYSTLLFIYYVAKTVFKTSWNFLHVLRSMDKKQSAVGELVDRKMVNWMHLILFNDFFCGA